MKPSRPPVSCPDCDAAHTAHHDPSRREVLKSVAVTAATLAGASAFQSIIVRDRAFAATPSATSTPETLVARIPDKPLQYQPAEKTNYTKSR